MFKKKTANAACLACNQAEPSPETCGDNLGTGDCQFEAEPVPAADTVVVTAPCRHAFEQINITFAEDLTARAAAKNALLAIEDKADHLGEVSVAVTRGDRAIAVTACYTDAAA